MESDEDFYCGIDIGTVNLGLCFFSSKRIIGYRGNAKSFFRYEIDTPVTEVNSEGESEYHSLVNIIKNVET